jgi:hypothetical protein
MCIAGIGVTENAALRHHLEIVALQIADCGEGSAELGTPLPRPVSGRVNALCVQSQCRSSPHRLGNPGFFRASALTFSLILSTRMVNNGHGIVAMFLH